MIVYLKSYYIRNRCICTRN